VSVTEERGNSTFKGVTISRGNNYERVGKEQEDRKIEKQKFTVCGATGWVHTKPHDKKKTS
jgi:hypothetical protein